MKKQNVSKRAISIFVVLVMIVLMIPFSMLPTAAAWNGSASSGFAGGTGSSYNPYTIKTAEQLAYFARTVDNGTTYSGKYIELADNIVLNDESFTFEPDTGLVKVTDGVNTAYLGTGVAGDTSGENIIFDTEASVAGTWYSSNASTETTTYSGEIYEWNPIGFSSYDSPKAFQGNFNGKGYTIEGVYINTVSNIWDSGLFAYIKNATVSNVGVIDSYILGGTGTGGIVADASDSTITNCYNSATVVGAARYYSSTYIGGVVGDLVGGSIANCHNTGIVIGRDQNNGRTEVGGVVGAARVSGKTVSVTNCYNAGAVYGVSSVGGVVGYQSAYEYSATVSACYNTGTVNGNTYVGGVVGFSNAFDATATVRNCYGAGIVNGELYVGGVVGYSTGSVTYGRTATTGVVTNCYGAGIVNGGSYVGGVLGGMAAIDGKFEKSHNTGRVNGTSNVGGVVGYIGVDMTNCYNTGTVNGSSYVGGIAGRNRESVMSNCYNVAAVYGNSSVGAILGYNEYGYGTVTNCYYIDGFYGNSGSNRFGTRFSLSQMEAASSYVGFDFNSVWEINTICGYNYPTLKSSISPKKSHEYENDCDSTCNVCSYERTPPHTTVGSYKYDETNHWRECGCGIQQNITAHTWNVKYNSTNHWEACLCGIQRNVASHVWDDGVITTAPTHIKEGVRTFTCACGSKRTEAVEKLTDHEWNDGVVTTEPTCTTEGVKTYTCPCGETYTEAVPVLEHYVNVYTTMEPEIKLENSSTYPFSLSGGRYTSTNKSNSTISTFLITALRDCSVTIRYGVSSETNYDWLIIYKNATQLDKISGAVSGKTLTISLSVGDYIKITYSKDVSQSSGSDSGYFEIVSGHAEEFITTERIPAASQSATCTNAVICDGCGLEVKPALAHEWDDGFITTEPTHLTEGVKTYTCTKCGETYTESVDKLPGHDHKATITAPKCTEAGYTTYTCDCGDSYISDEVDALGHDYTAEGDCAACGEYRATFSGASLTLEDNIAVNFKVAPEQFEGTGYTNPYVVFTFNGEQYTVTEYTFDTKGRYAFAFTDIAPRMMNDVIVATLYATYEGEQVVCQTRNYSVKEYCYNMLARCNAGGVYANNENFKALLVDLLNYGEAAQIYGNYKVDTLVTADLTDTQKSWATDTTPTVSTVQNLRYKTIKNPAVGWQAGGLLLEDAVTMRFKFSVDSIEDVTVKFYTDSNPTGWVVGADELVETTGGYYVYFDGLKARQMRESVYITVYRGDTAISNTVRYSIESYAYAKKNDSNAKLTALLEAMMKYGDSAYKYING